LLRSGKNRTIFIMLWVDRTVEAIRERYAKEIAAGTPLIIRDEKTASGRVHVGSMRGVAIHGVVSEALSELSIANRFLYEINDTDPMDDIPGYLDEVVYKPYLFRSLKDIPSPEPGAPNFAEYYGREFIQVITDTYFKPTFYRASELYESGRMNEVIRTALERSDAIREIYKRVSGSQKVESWLPISITSHECSPGEVPRALSFDGTSVSYVCVPIGEQGMPTGLPEHTVEPWNGNAKLPWKVEWAAKFKVVGVHIEGGGKDHSTKGGARDVANTISREVFEHEPPFDIPYEFFLIDGKKMASSKGRGSSAREVADLIPPEIFRLAHLGKDPKQAFNFDPAGDTIPVLYDTYDRLAEKYWSGAGDDQARLFVLLHAPEARSSLPRRFLPRFSQVAFIVQMPHMNLEEEVAKLKGEPLTEEDKQELQSRAHYARQWIEKYAPDDFKFELQTGSIPEAALQFSEAQKEALRDVLHVVESSEALTGEDFHKKLHDIKESRGIAPVEFFSALYLAFLGKASGPKAGWFLSVLDRDFLIGRLKAVTS